MSHLYLIIAGLGLAWLSVMGLWAYALVRASK